MSELLRRGDASTQRRVPTARQWRERVSDPNEPLYTIAVVSELLNTSHQTLRRLGAAIELGDMRSSGNQRRYSVTDIEALNAACELSARGLSPFAVGVTLRHGATQHARGHAS